MRFIPELERKLAVADLVSRDCYTHIIDRARVLRIVPDQGFRESPLIGLLTQFSPTLWTQGSGPPCFAENGLRNSL